MTTGNAAQGYIDATGRASSPSGRAAQATFDVASSNPISFGRIGAAFLEVIGSTVAVPPPAPTPAPVNLPTLGAWRANFGLNWLGMCLIGDVYTNVVGVSDYGTFTEYGNPMRFLVTSPPVQNDRKRIFISRFEIDVQAGQGESDGSAPSMVLEYSKDGGETWHELAQPRSMGAVGQYSQRLRWLNMGQSRSWIFRLTCTDPVRRQIIGTYLDSSVGLG